jgi:hypothetical protein
MIPPFTISGVLPPFTGQDVTHSASVSPFDVGMVDFIQHFGINEPRKAILIGLLNYRRDLRALGFEEGYQWIDGSFVEDVEAVRGRAPDDIDLVTIAPRPEAYSSANDWADFVASNADIFYPTRAKEKYKTDAYFIDLGKRPELIVEDATYWYGLFSHQRASALWKGMLRIPISSDDEKARSLLELDEDAEAP